MTLKWYLTQNGGLILEDDSDDSSFCLLSSELDQILADLARRGRLPGACATTYIAPTCGECGAELVGNGAGGVRCEQCE